MATLTTLTQDALTTALRDRGLAALGLTAPLLSPRWSAAAAAAFDPGAMTIDLGTAVRAPFSGTIAYPTAANDWFDAAGASIGGSALVLRMHPQAAMRIERLMIAMLGAAAAAAMPMPSQMVVRNVTGAGQEKATAAEAIALTGPGAATGRASFHDSRGLIIDPIAVACVFDALIQAHPGLLGAAPASDRTAAGGLQGITAMASGVRAQILDLHGARFAPISAEARIARLDASDAALGDPDANGLVDLAAGERLGPAGANAARVKIGWAGLRGALAGAAGSGVLAGDALTPPALPMSLTLNRRFLRAVAVDADWHLLGNRTTSSVRGVPGADDAMPDGLGPQVRARAPIEYLIDGPDVLGSIAEVLSGAAAGDQLVAVSPDISASLTAPAESGPNAHWPAFPGPASAVTFAGPITNLMDGVTAAWTSGTDVVLSFPAGRFPVGAHLRVFSRRFVVVREIGPAPSFVRGDGGAGIMPAAGALAILVRDPFDLAGGAKPASAQLHFDLVVTSLTGDRRRFGDQIVSIAAGPETAPSSSFGGTDPLSAIAAGRRGIGPSPLFGLPRPGPPPGGPAPDLITAARRLGSEASPRQAPRHPLQGRLETIVARGRTPDGDGLLQWDAVLTGARLTNESRAAQLRDGNPGNPAGPDIAATGVRVGGALAYDLARLGLKRCMSMAPLPGSPSTDGWAVTMAANAYNPPAATTDTGYGAVLQTVALGVETPELSSVPIPTASSLADVLGAITTALGLPSAPTISAVEPNASRILNEVRREIAVSRNGARDALWALRRAIAEARELIFIDGPAFSRTLIGAAGTSAHQIDLVAALRARMTAQPSLRVVISTARSGDIARAFGGHARYMVEARHAAVSDLRGADQNRVCAFHPVGYPGRSLGLRSTTVIVDDVWCMVGATHWRRRGLTFDGSVAVASFDAGLAGGYSAKVAAFRRALMGERLGVGSTSGDSAIGERARLASPISAFQLAKDLEAQQGLGRITPQSTSLPSGDGIVTAADTLADPDGAVAAGLGGLLAALLEAP
jgi:hypothetical protein